MREMKKKYETIPSTFSDWACSLAILSRFSSPSTLIVQNKLFSNSVLLKLAFQRALEFVRFFKFPYRAAYSHRLKGSASWSRRLTEKGRDLHWNFHALLAGSMPVKAHGQKKGAQQPTGWIGSNLRSRSEHKEQTKMNLARSKKKNHFSTE